jgi:hypothetical protein
MDEAPTPSKVEAATQQFLMQLWTEIALRTQIDTYGSNGLEFAHLSLT